MDFGIVPSVAIVIITFFVGYCVKTWCPKIDNKNIPAICMITGLVVSVLVCYLVPGVIDVNNVVDAIVLGIVSGFAATGVNELITHVGKPAAPKDVESK